MGDLGDEIKEVRNQSDRLPAEGRQSSSEIYMQATAFFCQVTFLVSEGQASGVYA
jgi:hypothetical protein